MDIEPLDGHLFGADQPCFGCGPRHPIGFRLAFERDGDGVVTRFVPGEQHQGPPGIFHGGLSATLADEIGAWAVIAGLGKFGFTVQMSGRLHKALRTGVEIVGRGRVTKPSRRVATVEVTLEQDGEVRYSGDLRFAILDRGAAESLLGGPIPEAWERFCRA